MSESTEKKDRIISTAQDLFAHFGIQKTTMDDIARAAGMGKATLYYYFKNKEDIFAAVINKEINILKDKIANAISKVETPQDKLLQYISVRVKHLGSLKNYYSTLTEELFMHYPFVEQMRIESVNHEIDIIKGILKLGVQKGIFIIEDVGIVARSIVIALKGLEFPILFDKTGIIDDIDNAIEIMLNILFKGLEKR